MICIKCASKSFHFVMSPAGYDMRPNKAALGAAPSAADLEMEHATDHQPSRRSTVR